MIFGHSTRTVSAGSCVVVLSLLVGCDDGDSNDSSVSATGGGTAANGTGGSSNGGTSATTLDAVAEEYVTAVNAVRAAVTEPANYSGTWTALPTVTWSDTVAASAQTWVDYLATSLGCTLEHEGQYTYGENLAAGTNLTPAAAVELWASEKSQYTWSAAYSEADFNAGSGHYTQLVWRESTQLGCASAACSTMTVIGCRFSPPGNVIGDAVY